LRLLHREVTVIAGIEANQFISKEGTRYLRSREFWSDFNAAYGAKKSMGGEDGPMHYRLRGVMKRSIARGTVQQRFGELSTITERIVRSIWAPGKSLSAVNGMQEVAGEQLGVLAAGRSPGDAVDAIRVFLPTMLNVHVMNVSPFSPVILSAVIFTSSMDLPPAQNLTIDG
jgi:cytochrome P450